MSRDAAGDISERDVVCAGAVAGARRATSGPVSVGETAGAEARTASVGQSRSNGEYEFESTVARA